MRFNSTHGTSGCRLLLETFHFSIFVFFIFLLGEIDFQDAFAGSYYSKIHAYQYAIILVTIICFFIYFYPVFNKTWLKYAYYKYLTFLFLIFAGVIIILFNDFLPKEAFESAKKTTTLAKYGVLKLFLYTVIITPILEELFFRKLLLLPLKKYFGALTAMIITTFLFAVAHELEPITFILKIFAGLIYSHATIKTNSIKTSMSLHMINNLIVFSLELFGKV